MKILHTADWHVGKAMRGRSRADEHRAVLAEIAAVAERERVDLVLVAGDLFDVSAPSPEAEKIVYDALLALADGGAHVVLVCGNHDHPRRFHAIKPLLERSGRVHAGAFLARAAEGGVITLTTRSGETARIALFPFLSKRDIVKAAALMEGEAADHAQKYAETSAALVRALCKPFSSDAVNLVVGHMMVERAVAGGGERAAHLEDDYRVAASCFDHECLHYVALGHVHRAQRIHAPGPAVWYSGSPLQLDFGETENEPRVLLVEARAGKPATVREHPIAGGRRLRTIRGSRATLEAEIRQSGDAYVRVILDEPSRPGLADEIRDLCPNAVEVQLAAERGSATGESDADTVDRLRRSPRQIFGEYLSETGTGGGDAGPVLAMFDELYEEANAPDAP